MPPKRIPGQGFDPPMPLFFVYTTGWVAMAAAIGGAVNTTLNILSDAAFQANYMTVAIRQAGVIVANWAGEIQIDDSAAGRTLFNTALCADAVLGGGGLPYPFNPPRLFSPNSSVVITVTNNVVTAGDFQIAFHGNKIRLGPGLEAV